MADIVMDRVYLYVNFRFVENGFCTVEKYFSPGKAEIVSSEYGIQSEEKDESYWTVVSSDTHVIRRELDIHQRCYVRKGITKKAKS